ncbi:MAG: hypothetical protein RLZZ368_1418, partial [Actinomycetota bacterium]
GEGLPPRVVAHVTFDWPSWSQTAYRRWYVDEKMEDQPSIEMEVVLRIQRIKDLPDLDLVRAIVPTTSPLIGDGRLERAGLTLETAYLDDDGLVEHAVEATFEGLYELAEESLADGASTLLDDHFGALGGWVAAMLVKMGDVKYTFLPAD